MVFSNVVILLFWFSLVDLNNGNECLMQCPRPTEKTPFFQIEGNALPEQLYYCRMSSKNTTNNVCTLNVAKVLQILPAKQGLSTFYFGVICPRPLRILFDLPKNFTKVDVISYLHVQDSCVVSAKDLAAWGRATDFRVVHLIRGVTLLEEQNQTKTDLQGLFNLSTITLNGLTSPGIPCMLTTFVWEKLAEVQFSRMSLSAIPDVLKKTMPHLQSLELSHNKFRKPPAFPWCNTNLELPRNLSRTAIGNEHYSEGTWVDPRIYRRFFSINFNPAMDVSKYEFTDGRLDKISLHDNAFHDINPSIFHKISNLQVMDLSQNKLRHVPRRIFENADGLVDVKLANNRLEFLAGNTFNKLRDLQKLDLSNNIIRTFPTGLLSSLGKLEEIDLRNNSLKTIEPKALPFRSNSLKRVYLQRNKLHRIPMCAFYSRNLEVFDMSDNAVDHRSIWIVLDLLDVSNFVFSHSTSASSVDKANHKIRKTLHEINLKLERNNIEHIDVTELNKIRLLKFELILKAFTFNLGLNPLICDCKIRELQIQLRNWTRNGEIHESQFESWTCHAPKDLNGKTVLSISQENLKCQEQYPKCPGQCECYRRSLDFPIFVDCRNRSLTKQPDELPDGSVELHLEYNQIQNLTFHETLRNVTVLHVSHNNLHHISSDSPLSTSKLNEIFLDSNRLTTLPQEFQNLRNLSKIDIQQNYFRCDCKNKWMKPWLLRLDHVVVGGARSVFCSSGKNQGKPLISVRKNDFVCTSPNESIQERGVYVTVAYVLTVVLLTFIVFGFVFRFRGELKIFLFTRLRWHPFDRVDDSDPSKIYDAFVSYSGRNAEWVMQTLKEKLENEDPSYKLCIHDRDFLVGATIFQNVFDSVKTSRRMIMVLSNSFLQSEWCMLEFRAAHRKVLKDRMNYLIIVLFDDVDIKSLDDELKLYLRTNTYLSVSNKWFWQRLRYALPQQKTGH